MGVENKKIDINQVVGRKIYASLNKKLSPESADRTWVSKLIPNWIKDYVSRVSKNGSLNDR